MSQLRPTLAHEGRSGLGCKISFLTILFNGIQGWFTKDWSETSRCLRQCAKCWASPYQVMHHCSSQCRVVHYTPPCGRDRGGLKDFKLNVCTAVTEEHDWRTTELSHWVIWMFSVCDWSVMVLAFMHARNQWMDLPMTDNRWTGHLQANTVYLFRTQNLWWSLVISYGFIVFFYLSIMCVCVCVCITVVKMEKMWLDHNWEDILYLSKRT